MKKDVFFGGLPTEPDIRRIREKFPASVLKPGKVIDYSEIEEIIVEDRASPRFKTVTNKWRKLVEQEDTIIIDTLRGVGFKIMDDPDKLNLSVSKLKTAGRMARRSYVLSSHIDRKKLNDDELIRLDHVSRTNAAVIAAAQMRKKQSLPTLEGNES